MSRTALPVFALIAALFAGGCAPSSRRTTAAPSPRSPNPALVATQSYDRLFDAAVAELRDRRFIVDRQDRRFGTVTSRPRTASSLFEPFQPDTASAARAAEATLNHLRRIIEVHLQPPGAAGLHTPADVPSQYELHVVVRLERRSRPNVPLTTAALGRPTLLHTGPLDRRLVTEEGLQESRWVAVDRDAQLEDQLLAAILKRAELP